MTIFSLICFVYLVHFAAVCGCRFVFSTPGQPDIENEVQVLAENMMSLRSRCTPSPVCPPPSDRAPRQVVVRQLVKSAVKSQNTVTGSFGEVGVMEFGLKETSRLVADVMGSRHSGLGFTVFWLFYGRNSPHGISRNILKIYCVVIN